MEESTLQSQENSLKEPQKTLLKLPSKNNVIPEWNNVVGDENVLAYYQISDIIPRILQTDSQMEGNYPLCKINSENVFLNPPLQHPATQLNLL